VVSRTPQRHFTPGKDPVPILQEAGWAPGPVSKDGKSRPHRDSIPDLPARSPFAIPTELPGPLLTLLVTISNQVSVTSKKYYAKIIFEISHTYLNLCSIYAIKILTFMKVIVQHTPGNCIPSVYVFRS